MKLKEYTSVIFDKVVIYKEMEIGDYIDLYKGERLGIPERILDMEVRSIGAKSKNTLDILVKIN
ncbi:hypothetical protein [uncultured Robinsoniella sp.]|uniref:hypothetical protein n=1 Tax=uncultured Robinsoniella sp. TaxID=904190 RepID=UPI00374FC44B